MNFYFLPSILITTEISYSALILFEKYTREGTLYNNDPTTMRIASIMAGNGDPGPVESFKMVKDLEAKKR